MNELWALPTMLLLHWINWLFKTGRLVWRDDE